MKKLVLFGSGAVAEKNLNLNPSFIVDNNRDLIGTSFHGLEIKDPSEISGKNYEYDVIICTTSVKEVKDQLTSYGYIWKKDFKVATVLEEKLAILELEESKFTFLISSGLPSDAKSDAGGGIYKVATTEEYPYTEKVYSGNVHGLIKSEEGYIFSCQGEGIVFLDEKYEVREKIKLEQGLRPHGIRLYEDKIYFVSSYQDKIFCVSKKGKIEKEYKISSKKEHFSTAQHHCNDLFIKDGFAYVSMFSITGNWKRNIFDGGILQIDLNTNEKMILCNDLKMPHNISFDNDGIKVMNSFKGEYLGNDFKVLGTLPGFVRGYDNDNVYHYIGESKNRNFSRLETGRRPVSIDSRITIVNKIFGFSRSLQLPPYISEIHSVIKSNT